MADGNMADGEEETTTFNPKFDENGLMPALVIEQSTGMPLMQAFVNQQALETTLKTGYANFWSRSRQAFWQKGETSGNRLIIKQVLIDCDQDSLVFMVEMEGAQAACHTGRKSCYYRTLHLRDQKDPQISLQFTKDEPLFDPEKVYGK